LQCRINAQLLIKRLLAVNAGRGDTDIHLQRFAALSQHVALQAAQA
jgi:hypothetical protein